VSTSQKRDTDIDRLLRAVLKPAPRQPDESGFEAGAGCPDADMLAAFVEGGLTATERLALEAHLAGCGRCQEALSVVSEELPEQSVAESAAPESRWFTWVTQPRLRWFVPIGAAATVAVVFFATRPLIAPEGGDVVLSEPVQMAQAPAPPAEVRGAGAGASREQSAAVPEKSGFAGSPERQEAGRRQANQSAEAKQAAEAPPRTPVGQAAPDAMGAMPATLQTRDELRRLEPVATVTAAPDGRVRWRLGPSGRIWQSTDAGSTWHWQPADVSADLVAGSAPSATTCWAVGTGGVVLLTVDGQRWTLLAFPLSVDLAAVEATNDRVATVTTRDGRRFETLDAGRTWSPKQ